MGTQNIGCAACGHVYPLPAGATEVVCPECGHPYSATGRASTEGDEAYVAPDPEGAAIGRIPLRRKRISKTKQPVVEQRRDVSGVDLPHRPPKPIDGEELRASEARRALGHDELLAGYGRPVVHDLSVPGLDPPPIPVDSDPDLRLQSRQNDITTDPAPAPPQQAVTPADHKARPAVVPPQRRRPRRGALEVAVPAAGLEQRTTEGDAAIMVFVPDAPAVDEAPAAERIGGGHHRRSRPTVPMAPGERPRVRRLTDGQGSARANQEDVGRSSVLAWVLFLVGLLAAVTLYLMLTHR